MEHMNHRECLKPKKLRTIDFISFLMGFSQAILIYVISSYFKEASGTDNVGFFYFISYATVLIALLNFHKIIRKFGKFKTFAFIYIIKIGIIAALAVLPASIFGSLFLMAYIIFGTLGWTAMDIILESYSVDKRSGRIRGLYLTITNAGFIFGPFISSHILETCGFSAIFIISLVLHVLEYLIAYRSLRGANHEHSKKETIKEVLARVARRPNILKAYYISFVLDCFYAVMVVFSPLYLLSIGMSWDQIGLIFTAMLVPFVMFQYPAGVLADKKYGEKKLIILSLFIIGFSTLAVFFSKSDGFLFWLIVMFISRIGASLLEITRDSYFYKRIDGDDIDLIDFFRTSRPAAYLVSTFASTLLLLYFSMQSVFLFLAIVIFIGLYPAFKLADNQVVKECEE